MSFVRSLLLAITSIVCVSAGSFAQTYPAKSITIVVPLAAGSGMDSVVRIYADELSAALGKPVVIENQPGAGLMLAAQTVAKAAPDGYTLLVSATTVMTANKTLSRKINYDPEKDFIPISLYVDSPFMLIVSPTLKVDSMRAFIDLAKARSATPITYATTGTGGLPHLSMESFRRDLGFPANHVPYRNSGQIVTDVLGGHLDAALSEIGVALELVRDGKLQSVGISSAQRHPLLPHLPTMAEAAGKSGFEAVAWHVLVAPAATPKPIVERLVAEMRRITGEAAFIKRVSAIGLVPRPPATSEEILAYIGGERSRWDGVVRKLGLEGSQ